MGRKVKTSPTFLDQLLTPFYWVKNLIKRELNRQKVKRGK